MAEERYDRQYAEFRKLRERNPDLTFAQYAMEQSSAVVQAGVAHHSLGPSLRGADGELLDFWDAGRRKATAYFRDTEAQPRDKVIEYGCGSLRVGAHFIRYLRPGKFFGLDVVPDFIEMGKALIGPDLLREKAPVLRVISKDSISEAEAFGADIVYSNAVCIHVHPDEIGAYFQNLLRLTHRRGARLFFNAAVADEPVRYNHLSWAWPLEFYKDSLKGLECVRSKLARERTKGDEEIRPTRFEFRRGPASKVRGMRKYLSKLGASLSGNPGGKHH